MAKLLNLRLGVSDDPTALQPTLGSCISTVLEQCELLVANVVEGLVVASAPAGPRRVQGLQQPGVRRAIESLQAELPAVRESFRLELSRLMYEGGGKDESQGQALRFEDIQLLGDAELDQNIELARAQQEVLRVVEDVLPQLDALVSTLLGWSSSQPGLNPLRPEVFVRALQTSLASHIDDNLARDALIVPSAGLLGSQLRTLYRELVQWLLSTGVEPAFATGRRKDKEGAVAGSVAKTLLTLDRLRKLLAGDFDDADATRREFVHTVPASMALLQEMKGGVDQLVRKLETERPPRAAAGDAPRVGRQLGEQVVHLMFDNLSADTRLMPAYKTQLRALEPALLALAQQDSRFFSDRKHPGRQLLDRMTQRSLAFSSESDEGWTRFLASIEEAAQALGRRPGDAEFFREQLEALQAQWHAQDEAARQRRAEAARALMHAEQRNLLAARLAAEFDAQLEGCELPDFVANFLHNVWPQVVAETQLSVIDGTDDPLGYRAAVEDLAWSVQPVRRERLQRLASLIPGLIARLREGLHRIGYPPGLMERFFERLGAIHASDIQDGRDTVARQAAEEANTAPSEFGASAFEDSAVWLASREVQDAGYLEGESLDLPEGEATSVPSGPLATGTWVELMVQGQWRRVQLTWASPHQTLFMFTSATGTAHSMSRRTLERLRAADRIRVVAGRHVIDEALDQVAKAALRNSLEPDRG